MSAEVGYAIHYFETHITGTLTNSTALHSFQFSGTIEKRPCRNGVYSRAKCSTIDRVIAYTRIMFSHRGSVMRDSLEERAFIAFNISITTKLQQRSIVILQANEGIT